MLREALVHSIQKIRDEISDLGILDVINDFESQPTPSRRQELLKIFLDLHQRLAQFSDIDRAAYRSFGLDSIFNNQNISLLVTPEIGVPTKLVLEMRFISKLLQRDVPHFIALLEQDRIFDSRINAYVEKYEDFELSIDDSLIKEKGGDLSLILRALDHLNNLYIVCEQIRRSIDSGMFSPEQDDSLKIVKIDYGSKILLYLSGVAISVSILLGCLNRVIVNISTSGPQQEAAQADAMLRQLDVIEKLGELMRAGKISTEQYNELRHKLISRSRGTVLSGLLPPFVEASFKEGIFRIIQSGVERPLLEKREGGG